jgi:hypothetical protein
MRVRIALLMAAGTFWLPAAVALAHDVQINIGLGLPSTPPIVVTAPPQLVVIPGTAVSYAPEVPANYFFYHGRYYTMANGAWFTASAFNGPWVVITVSKVPKPVLSVPVDYYKIPPGHVKKKGPPPWAGHGHGPKSKSTKPKDK